MIFAAFSAKAMAGQVNADGNRALAVPKMAAIVGIALTFPDGAFCSFYTWPGSNESGPFFCNLCLLARSTLQFFALRQCPLCAKKRTSGEVRHFG